MTFKKITLSSVVAMLCFIFPAMSQTSVPKPLRVGDQVPKEFWLQWHATLSTEKPTQVSSATANAGLNVDSLQLNSHQGKLLILDFWATWCGGCLTGFPLLSKLQHRFADRFQAVIVHHRNQRDSLSAIQSFLEKRIDLFPDGKVINIVRDNYLLSCFPHRTIPHYVWIWKGRIAAITDEKFLKEEMISTFLN